MPAEVVFKSKGFRYSFWPSILIVTQVGLAAMAGGFMMGLHPFLVTLLMLASVWLSIGFIGAHTTYVLSNDGIRQELRPFQWSPVKMKPGVREFGWNDIKSYKSGSDLSRSMEHYNYLYISLRKFPHQLRLSDHQASKEDLAIFLNAFEMVIETGTMPHESHKETIFQDEALLDSKPIHSATSSPRQRDTEVVSNIGIRRRPDFYDTRLAHVLFWIFTLVFVFIGYAMVTTGNVRSTNLWRISFVIIPGMSYFAWRLYGRQGRR